MGVIFLTFLTPPPPKVSVYFFSISTAPCLPGPAMGSRRHHWDWNQLRPVNLTYEYLGLAQRQDCWYALLQAILIEEVQYLNASEYEERQYPKRLKRIKTRKESDTKGFAGYPSTNEQPDSVLRGVKEYELPKCAVRPGSANTRNDAR